MIPRHSPDSTPDITKYVRQNYFSILNPCNVQEKVSQQRVYALIATQLAKWPLLKIYYVQCPKLMSYEIINTFHGVLSDVSSNCLPEQMHSHIGCICLTFLYCGFSNVSSNGLPQRKHSHIGCICFVFLHCAFSNVSLNYLDQSRHIHIGCTYLTFLRCGFSNVSLNYLDA